MKLPVYLLKIYTVNFESGTAIRVPITEMLAGLCIATVISKFYH